MSRMHPVAMEGRPDSPPFVLDTGNPCRYDGCICSIEGDFLGLDCMASYSYPLNWLVPKLQLGNPCLSSSCLFVDRSSGSWSFKDRIPKLELVNELRCSGAAHWFARRPQSGSRFALRARLFRQSQSRRLFPAHKSSSGPVFSP